MPVLCSSSVIKFLVHTHNYYWYFNLPMQERLWKQEGGHACTWVQIKANLLTIYYYKDHQSKQHEGKIEEHAWSYIDIYVTAYAIYTKLVVLTTELLPWLQSSWRDSSNEKFNLVWKINCIRQPPEAPAQFIFTATIHWQPSEHLWRSHYK